MNESKILAGLLDHLKLLTDGLSPPYPVAWPDDPDFVAPTEDGDPLPYIKPFWLPARPSSAAVSEGTTVHRGVFQVGIFWPQRKWATLEAGALADVVAQHFKAETRIYYADVSIDVIVPPSLGPKIDGTPPQFPVSVFYEANIG